MTDEKLFPVPFVLIRKDCVVLDGETNQLENKLRIENNNGRKILAITVRKEFGEKLIENSIWNVPYVLPTSDGGIEVATFTEYSGQDRHYHKHGIEIYTVLKGRLEIYIDDKGPYILNAMDEVVILPSTIHEVVQQKPSQQSPSFDEFNLLVRVHSINCFGDVDKYVQLGDGSDWVCWKDLDKEKRKSAYRLQDRN